jgi:hypothetical protein
LFILVCVFWFLFVSVFPCLVIVRFFLWLPEEELTLMFLLHHENGDFSILMKDISFIVCGARQHHVESSVTASLVTETHYMNGSH